MKSFGEINPSGDVIWMAMFKIINFWIGRFALVFRSQTHEKLERINEVKIAICGFLAFLL